MPKVINLHWTEVLSEQMLRELFTDSQKSAKFSVRRLKTYETVNGERTVLKLKRRCSRSKSSGSSSADLSLGIGGVCQDADVLSYYCFAPKYWKYCPTKHHHLHT